MAIGRNRGQFGFFKLPTNCPHRPHHIRVCPYEIIVDKCKEIPYIIFTGRDIAPDNQLNESHTMTKSETRELLKIIGYLDETNLRGLAARSLATLIRSTRGRNTRAELLDFARVNRLNERIEFKI